MSHWSYYYHQSGSCIEPVLTSSKRTATYQQAHDVPRTSPKDPLKILRSRTSRRPSGDFYGTNTKVDDLMKILFFKCNSPCFTHPLLFFTEIYIYIYIYICVYIYIYIYIFKRSKWGRPGAVYGSHLWDLPGTKWWDVLETSSGRWPYMFFKSNSKTY